MSKNDLQSRIYTQPSYEVTESEIKTFPDMQGLRRFTTYPHFIDSHCIQALKMKAEIKKEPKTRDPTLDGHERSS